MESAAVLRSFPCSGGIVANVQCFLEKPGLLPTCNVTSNKSSFTQGLTGGGRLILSSATRKTLFVPCVKASETALAATADLSSDSSSQDPLEKKSIQNAPFPNGFEALVLEVCDETDVAELKLKIGDFQMTLRRNIGTTQALTPVVSHEAAPPVPSKPMVESASTPPPPSPSRPSSETTSPFKNVPSSKELKLAALEASGATGYVVVSSPTVGSFRRGRTVKGKKQPPICKEGDTIKEGQVIGYVDQFGSELPVKSDVAGEVLKLLNTDGEAVGYGDPLLAVLPSFHGINLQH